MKKIKIKQQYIVYKITNLVNGKVYIGVHKTKIIKDDYMGSGRLIRRAINKYGIKNFKKEIIARCDNEEEMYEFEAKLVNDDFLKNCRTYNLINGGFGGWNFVNNNIWTNEKRIQHGKKYGSKAGSWQCPEKRRKILETIPIEKRQQIGKSMGDKFGGFNKFTPEDIQQRLEKIKHIDLMKYGWVNEVAEALEITHTQVRRFMKKFYKGSYYRRANNSAG